MIIVFRSGRDASVPQAVTRNPRASFLSSNLNSLPFVLEEPRNGRERFRGDVTNPTNCSKRGKKFGNTGLMNQALLFHPRSLTSKYKDIKAGTFGLPPASNSRRRKRYRSQEPPKDNL